MWEIIEHYHTVGNSICLEDSVELQEKNCWELWQRSVSMKHKILNPGLQKEYTGGEHGLGLTLLSFVQADVPLWNSCQDLAHRTTELNTVLVFRE